MTELNWLIYCLIIAALLPYIAKMPLASAMKQQGEGKLSGYDNELPREQQKKLTGFGARCLAAHENSFEALILFSISVLLVIATGHVDSFSVILSILFIVCRIAYLVFYWINWDKLRSTVWFIGIISNIAMMIHCL
ncbi:MAPEG family protein [uncultured Psychrosphaera sp.]|uniref:MAPEG family protein n=1 Tax=uncultured Psychrosphaera sp. TaxID=1403522 RepID=UPI00262B884D|nr:MAPEG family protein [uncultured Psychrosphaera sp.]